MSKTIRPVKGTVDYYPEDMAVRKWLYTLIGKVSESFGYEEWEGPILETIELYAAKSGEELVKEQSFVFPDRGGNLIALRPELTPTLARLVAQRQRQLTYPLRWWSYGPFWRYERPQKGRTREFFQWNIDAIGPESPEIDAELASVGAAFFKAAGLTPDNVKILVNNRKLMDTELDTIGVPGEKRSDVFRLIDRRDKLSAERWEQYAMEIGLSTAQLDALIEKLGDESLWENSEDLTRFFKAAEKLGVGDYIKFAPNIIRGLDYYTGTVFEARDRDEEFRSILGGGRYDSLVADVGGERLPASGFAMGDKVVTLVLQKFGCLPTAESLLKNKVLVTIFDENTILEAFAVSTQLRDAGLTVVTYPEPVKLGKQFKYAEKIGAKAVVIIGPEEAASGQIAVKNLVNREQVSYEREKGIEILRNILAN